jgi:hypothetical protein
MSLWRWKRHEILNDVDPQTSLRPTLVITIVVISLAISALARLQKVFHPLVKRYSVGRAEVE